MTAVAFCRHCGEPIRWVRTSHGHPMPLDPAPDPDGNVVITLGAAIVTSQPLPFAPRFMPHAATCTGSQREPPEKVADPYQQIDLFTEESDR